MNTRSRFLVVPFVICLLSVPVLLLSQSASALFEQGLLKENAEGNLDQAIVIFNRIVEDKTADPAIRARAQLQVGICYEKLGRREARAAYQRVIDNYPQQQQEVALARERIGRLAAASRVDASRPSFRKINFPNSLNWDAQLSPDGKSVGLVDKRRLWIVPTSSNLGPGFSGTPRVLDTQGVEIDWPGFTWSADGRSIAFNGAKVEEGRQRIYVVPAVGGRPVEVFQNNRHARVVNYRMSLSPDGETLAFASLDEGVLHIYKKPVKGGSPVRVVDAPAREPVFSPDGKMIAYVESLDVGRGGGGLWVISADGSVPARIAEAGNASTPVWSPDGQMIAFVDYAAADRIRVVRLRRDGKAPNEEMTIACPQGFSGYRRLAGWTSDNVIWAVVETPIEFALYAQGVEGGKATFVARGGYPVQPRWSPDGKRIFHVNRLGSEGGGDPELGIAYVPAEGGDVTWIPLQSEVKIRLGAFGTGLHVSPDGRTIVFAGQRATAPTETMHIWKVAVEGGKPRQLTDAPAPSRDLYPCWSPDGRSIGFVRMSVPKQWTEVGEGNIYIVSAEGGEPRQITSASDRVFSTGPVMWSPDGRLLAFFSRDAGSVDGTLKIIPAEGGQARVVARVRTVFANKEMAWSPDSRRIAYNHLENKIGIVTLDDGSVVEIEPDLKDVKKIYHLDWSPDGKTLVFGGYAGGGPEIWTIENFLPPAGRK